MTLKTRSVCLRFRPLNDNVNISLTTEIRIHRKQPLSQNKAISFSNGSSV